MSVHSGRYHCNPNNVGYLKEYTGGGLHTLALSSKSRQFPDGFRSFPKRTAVAVKNQHTVDTLFKVTE